MVHNVKPFLKNYLVYFPIALGVWQILKFTPLAGLIKGLMGRLLSLAFPGFFPGYKQLECCPGRLFKTVKCVVLTKGMSQSKTKPLTNPENQVTTTSHRSENTPSKSKMYTHTTSHRSENTPPTPRSKMSIRTTLNSTSSSDSEASTGSSESEASTGASKPQPGPKMSTHTTSNTTLNGTGSSKSQASTGASKPQPAPMVYLGETFEVKEEGNKVSVREWSYYNMGETFEVKEEGNKVSVREWSYYNMSNRQWNKICQMEKKCFKKKAGEWSEKENEVVFVKGCKFIWQKIVTGKVMEFGEVLDDVILGNNDTLLISNDVWFLPVDLLEKSEGKLPKLLNLVGLIPRVSSRFWVTISLTIAAAVLEFSELLRSLIYENINKMFCRLVQYICNKLPYSARHCVYLLFIWVENLRPRNDILLKVKTRDSLNVFIGGVAKTNSPKEATRVDWLDQEEKEYEFRCGCSIVMKAEYNHSRRKCKATVQHTNAVFGAEKRVFLKCQCREEFRRIGTFLSCLAASKTGSLFKYDCNDNKVHVRGWRESLRHYVDAGFPHIYKLTLHDVIV